MTEQPPVSPTETTEVCWEDTDESISQASVSITQLREDGQATSYPARPADGEFCLDFQPEPLRKEPILGESVVRGARSIPLSLVPPVPLEPEGFPPIRLETFATGLGSPVGFAHAGDGSDRLFVIDQRGRIDIIQGGTLLPTPFLDIEAKLVPERPGFDERGLLGLAFHPDYAANGRFYVYYSAPTDSIPMDHHSVVAEYRVSTDPDIADPDSERILFTVPQPQFNHDAGQLAFGPDGFLYISLGDGGRGNDVALGHCRVSGNAQDTTNVLGSLLRIDVDGSNSFNGQYGIPADNPFVDDRTIPDETWAYGLRNPWRFSFDRGTGRLFLADAGQRIFEEINIIEKGGNYGWNLREGAHPFDPDDPSTAQPDAPPPDGVTDPIAEYTHPGTGVGTEIGIVVVGGFVYRGNGVPGLQGRYVFADWSTVFAPPGNGTLLGLEEFGEEWLLSVLEVDGGNPIGLFITAFGEDEDGELYVAAKPTVAPEGGTTPGIVFRIDPALPTTTAPAPPPTPTTTAPASPPSPTTTAPGPPPPPSPILIDFESPGTPVGQDPFTVGGVIFSGGIAGTTGFTPFYSSGVNSFEVSGGTTATITFSSPASSLNMFLVHRVGTSGIVRVFGSEGQLLNTINSQVATFFGDPGRFVSIDEGQPIFFLEVEAGGLAATRNVFIDDLEYVPA